MAAQWTTRRVLTMSVAAGTGIVTSDAIGDRLWVKDGRDTSANADYYRGAAQIALSLAAGKALSSYSMDAGVGLGLGGAAAGVVRIGEKAKVVEKLRNALDGSGNGTRRIPLPYVAPAAALPAGTPAATTSTTTTTTTGAPQPLTAGNGVNNGLGVVVKRVIF